MKLKFLSTLMILVISSCSNAEISLTIGDAERIGFDKSEQQYFQMIGAIDGWSGTWEGEVVELYQYESSDNIEKKFPLTITDTGNISGWIDKCIVGNMIMISKGKKSCPKLKSLVNS